MKRTLSFCTLILAGACQAQYAVVPSAFTNTAASTHGFNVLMSTTEKTGQMLINANQLTNVAVGSSITGLSYRLYTGATSDFPTTAINYADYTISMGQSIAPSAVQLDGNANTTFASNFTGTTQTVRTGALSIAPLSFTHGATPNAWGIEITFQNAYVYTGGNLGIQISHSTRSGSTSPLFEIAGPNDAGTAAGDYGFYYGSGAGVTTGAQDGFTVTRLTVTPEPAPFLALGLGALVLVRRRRA